MSLRPSSLGLLLGYVAACSSVGPVAAPQEAGTPEKAALADEVKWLALSPPERRPPLPPAPPQPPPASAPEPAEPEIDPYAMPAITGDGKRILTESGLIDVEKDATIKVFADTEALEAYRSKDLKWEVLERISPVTGASSDGASEMVSTVGNLLIGYSEPTLRFGDATSREVLSSKKVVWWMQASSRPFLALPGEPVSYCPREIGALRDAFITKDRKLLLVELDYMQPSCICGDGGHGFHVTKLSAANVALAKAPGPPDPAAPTGR